MTDQETNQERSPARERAVPDKKFTAADPAEGQEPRNQPARPDPRTGEVPAGPGDAGLSDRPEANAGSPGISRCQTDVWASAWALRPCFRSSRSFSPGCS